MKLGEREEEGREREREEALSNSERQGAHTCVCVQRLRMQCGRVCAV